MYLNFPRFVFLQHKAQHIRVRARQQPQVQGVLGERKLLEEHCKDSRHPSEIRAARAEGSSAGIMDS